MLSKIKMPASGQNAAESILVKWNVKVGDEVERGDVLFEIETDKATMTVESYAKGTVLKTFYDEGELVQAGEVVAYIGKQGEAVGEQVKQSEKKKVMEEEYQPIIKVKEVAKISSEIKTSAQAEVLLDKPNSRVMASAKARRLANDSSIDISLIYDTLKRVVKVQDVADWKRNEATKEYKSIKPSHMRKAIARRMLQSTTEAPQFTVTIKVNMTEMIELRKSINATLKSEGVKISYNDLLAKCVCFAAKKVPYINSIYTDEEIRLLKNVNVGIAVGIKDGLVVPVIKGVQARTIKDIAHHSKELIEKAQSGKLEVGDMQGGTITISNLGMYGIYNFTALVNQPESAILAVGGIVETPVGINGEVVLRSIMDITASFDHRIIDGSVGAQFMAELKKFIEQPLLIMV
jgi:pyruvate dehydrogenase E2 component (dihydrolipoamide acetyltransferase)